MVGTAVTAGQEGVAEEPSRQENVRTWTKIGMQVGKRAVQMFG